MSEDLPALAAAVHVVRGQRVMLDSDLAALYGVETRRLNEQVKRNAARFPDAYMFQLTVEEFAHLMSQFATSSGRHAGLIDAIRQLTQTGREPQRGIGFTANISSKSRD